MAAKVSKNARSGVRQTPRKHLCAAGHERVSVLVYGRGMRLLCACDGFAPIDATRPYLQLKAPEAMGKAGLPRKDKGCVPQVAS